MFESAYNECIELQVMERHAWYYHTAKLYSKYPRIEFHVKHNGWIIGAMILVGEYDEIHVQKCMTVLSQYILPEFRNRGIERTLLCMATEVAQNNLFPVLAYSHRVGDWEYRTKYRRVP